jgi:hypothetical protein
MSKKNQGAGARPVSDAKKREQYPSMGATPKAVHEDGVHSSPSPGARKKVR